MAQTFEIPPEVGGLYKPLGKAEITDHDDERVRLKAGSATVEVTALASNLFRVGMFPEGRPPDYVSEAVAKESWEPVEAKIRENDGLFTLSTDHATVRITLDPLRVSFADGEGIEFAADDRELGMGVILSFRENVF